jgi:hypothetical protein
LIDIEGDEYEILGEENLNKLNGSPLIVEMHEFYKKPDQMKQFNDFVENYSRQTTIYGDTIDPNEKIFEEY